MLGDALYYPHIDIQDGAWLRSAILYWNSIKTIAPTSGSEPYSQAETRILWEEGFLEPLRCDLHPELLERLGRRVIALMDEPNRGVRRDGSRIDRDLPHRDWLDDLLAPAHGVGRRIHNRFHVAHIAPEKLSPSLRDFAMRAGLAWMHPAKLSPEIRYFLEGMTSLRRRDRSSYFPYSHMLQLESGQDNQWLLVNGDFANVYMSALASLLAKEGGLSALTNEKIYSSVNSRFILDEAVSPNRTDKFGAFISLFMESIKIDPSARVQDILEFRRSREHQLAELSAQFEDLSSKIPTCENNRELEGEVRRIYDSRIRPKLEALKAELRDTSIQSTWQGFHRAVTITVPAGGALAYLTGYSGIDLLCAGVAIAVADVAVMSHLAKRKARRASPYSYLLDVERTFQSVTS